jgi:hypothetical protein
MDLVSDQLVWTLSIILILFVIMFQRQDRASPYLRHRLAQTMIHKLNMSVLR